MQTIESLSRADKLRMMEALWDDLTRDAAFPVPAWHGDVLAARRALLDQGKEPVSAWGDAKQRIRGQTAKG